MNIGWNATIGLKHERNRREDGKGMDMNLEQVDFAGKKLLILSGCGSQCKLVAAAKQMGVYTIVADYFAPSMASPAKLLADKNWMESLLDIDALVERCRKEHVHGVLAGWSDISQIPYFKICEQLGFPCHGTEEQFYKMTNKKAFKQLCGECGIDVIDEYSLEDAENGNVVYPVFVKPVDGRGSKGQAVCHGYEEMREAIAFAKKESSSGDVLIEHYVANTNSFQVTYFFVNGEAYLLRTADGYKGTLKDKLDRVALCTVSPSVYTEKFMKLANENFVKMLKKIGYQNGPAMAQAFYDNGVFRFYDPGLRFPGVDYEIMYKNVYNVDFMKAMVYFALTGEMPEMELHNSNVCLEGKKGVVLFPALSAGTIQTVNGFDRIGKDSHVFSVQKRYGEGDRVEWTYTTRQRLAEIDLLCNDERDMKEAIKNVQSWLDVRDDAGRNMLYMPFDTERIMV